VGHVFETRSSFLSFVAPHVEICMRVVDCGLSTTLVQKSTQGTACVGSGGQHPCKWQAFVGADAIGSGRLTRGQLRWNYTAVHPGVYLPNGAERTIHVNAVAAWLWTGRKGMIASRAAAALHGARWVDASTPIEIIAENTRKRGGVIVREEQIRTDEVTCVGELPVTTVARTALDLARFLPRDIAVAHLDAIDGCVSRRRHRPGRAVSGYAGHPTRPGRARVDGRRSAVAKGNVAAARPNRWRVTKAANPDQGQ